MSTIFLSYRRDDSAAACGRVYDRLAGHFGKDLVFKDVDDIPYGVNFPEYLAEKLRECRVQLVIIGKYWLTLTGPDGGRRLDAPNDFVRIEVEAGLRNGLLIVPLLVDNARMPEADDLPESIRLLIERNAAQVRPDPDFHTDMERLIRRLEDLLGMPHTSYTGGASASAQAPDPVIVQLVHEIETAYGAQAWRLVIDKAHYLLAKAGTNTPPIAILRYGEALLAAGDVAEASNALGMLHQQKIGDLRILREAADALAQAKEYAGAAALLEDELALVENDADRLTLLTSYCHVLVQLKRWDVVVTRATEGSRLAPNDPMWPRWMCDAAGRLGRFTEALTIARALTARPDATVYDWLARAQLAYTSANNVASEEARSALDSAARLSAEDHPAVAQARDQILPLPAKLASLGFTLRSHDGVEFIVPPLCDVPAGAFEMGTQLQFFPDDARSLKSGRPQHTVKVDAFQIGRFPVTVAEYACFVRTGYYRPGDLKWGAAVRDGVRWRHQLRRPDHPVVDVDWEDAKAYAAWLARLTGQPWRLPTEAEWEKAARWDPQHRHSRLFPWGETLDLTRCNVEESGIKDTTPVYAYPGGVSPCGAWDMSGNVLEWTSSLCMPYPYNPKDGREQGFQTQSLNYNPVQRGGSWEAQGWAAHAAYRRHFHSGDVRLAGGLPYLGVRLALGSH